jgi:hypothetical protein
MLRWQIIVIARCASITTTLRPRQNLTRIYPLQPMTPNVLWIAAFQVICGTEQQFPATLAFHHRQ